METCLIIQMSQVVSYSVIRGLEELKSNQKVFSIQFFLCLIFSVGLINFLILFPLHQHFIWKNSHFLKKNFLPYLNHFFSIERESIERARFFIPGPLVISGFDCIGFLGAFCYLDSGCRCMLNPKAELELFLFHELWLKVMDIQNWQNNRGKTF